MKSALLQTAIVAIVAGAASAALTSTLFLAGSTAERGRALPAAQEPVVRADGAAALTPADGDLRGRIAELAQENRALVARIEALEARPAAARVPLATDAERVASLAPTGERATRSMADTMLDFSTDTPEFQEGVEQALARIRAEELAEAERLRQEQLAARVEERVSRLTDELGLTRGQATDMRTYLLAREAGRDELRRIREGEDRDAYREARERLNQEGETALMRILSPAQLAAYQQRDDERDRGGGDRGRRDGGRRPARDG